MSAKVIDMFTKKEIIELPYSKEVGDAIIESLLEFELEKRIVGSESIATLISDLIMMVENSTGASRYEVMDIYYKKVRGEG